MTQDSEVEEHLQLQARRGGGGGGARLCSLLRSTLQGCTVTDSPDADDPFNIQPLHHFQLQQILSNISEQDLSLAENVLQVDDTDIVPEKSIQESMEMDNMSEMFKENAQNGISYNKDLRREGSVTKKRPLDEDSRTFGSDLNIQNNVSVDEYIEAANQSYDNILKGSCKNRGTRREGSGRLITKKPYDIFSSSAGTESKFQFDNVIYEDVEEYFRAAERHEIANAIKRKMKGEKTPDSPTYDSQKRRPRRQGTGRKIVARNFDVDLPDFAASYAEIDKEELQTEEERLINTFISSSRKSPILLTDAECNESNSKGVCNTVGMEELLALKVKQDDRHSLKNQHSIMEDLIILKSLEDQGASTSLELQQVESTMANKDVFKFTEEKVNNSMEFVQANEGMEANCIPLVDTSPSIEEPSNCEIVNSPVKLVPANELTEGSRIPETDALRNSEEPSQCHIVNSPKLVQVDEQIISGSVPTTGLEKEFIENSDNRLYTTLLQSQTASSDPMGAQSFTNELDDMSHLSQQLVDCLAAAEPLPDNLVSASADGRNDINSQIVSPSKMCIDEQPHDDSVKISQAENSCATLSQPLVCSSVQQNDNFPSLGILNTSPSSSHLKSGLKKLRKSLDFSSHVVDHNSGLFYPAATCLENKPCSPQQKKSCMSSSAQPFQMQDQHEVNSQSKSDASRDDACVELMQIDVRHDKATSDCGVSAIDEEKEESVAKSVRRNAKRKKMKSPLVIKQPLITHNGEQNVNNMETTAKDKGKRRKKRESQRRPSLVGAGSLWKSGVRRSTRIRSRPLEYWRGERFLYGRIHESLATVIGIKYSSPVTSKSKLKEVPKLKVRSFVDDKYSDLLELASKC